eukprot:TRINITY_DN384_c0_g2_i3.p1 TRINITY_DN384_c0_g2~~TRINITY_DN384_c0_g2_i3.p1  ORF type:complete len:442 (-),score=101.97 TRINITY_DN384_c0_g2_i3:54-1379(-)
MDDNDLIYDEYDGMEEDGEDERTPETVYYEAKGHCDEGNISDALESLEDVINLEEGKKTEWGFKATKKMVKIHTSKANIKMMEKSLARFLSYTSCVSPNTADKGLLSIIDSFTSSKNKEVIDFTRAAFDISRDKLKEMNNSRLWFRVSQRMCKVLMALKQFEELNQVLEDMHKSCQDNEGEDDPKKSSQLVEIYSMKIQLVLSSPKQHINELKSLCSPARFLSQSSIPNALVLAVIKEGCGVLAMQQRDWAVAYEEFFDAFKGYDESGVSEKRRTCLRYLVLTSILKSSVINPFESPETKPYRNAPEVVLLDKIYKLYEQKNLKAFIQCMKELELDSDPLFQEFQGDLIRVMRVASMSYILKPFSKITISALAQKLEMDPKECEDIVVVLISDGKISMDFHQEKGILSTKTESIDQRRYSALSKWASETKRLEMSLIQKMK